MSSNFVPFPSAASTGSGRPEQPAFAPVIPTTPQGPGVAQAIPHPATTSNKAKGHAPIVDVEREGDRITRIRIQCSCGELIELDCQY